MHSFRRAVLGAAAAMVVCMGLAAVHVWQAHGSGVASARSQVNSLPIVD
jgi:hypothetical protein